MVFTQAQTEKVNAFIRYGKNTASKKNVKDNFNKFAEELKKIHYENKDKNLERVKGEINPIYNLYEGLDTLRNKDNEYINKFLAKLKDGEFGTLTPEEQKNIKVLELFF